MIHLSHPLVDVLMQRGIEDIDTFLMKPSIANLTGSANPEGLADAADRILRAIRVREPILLFGDYDCDGILGTGILLSALKTLGGIVHAHLPHRDEGYGFGCAAAFRAARQGLRFIITIDNGIHAGSAITLATRLGVELIVVDHHLRSEPVAVPIVWSDALSGAGLAWMLAAALLERVNHRQREEKLLSLAPFAAIAGVADCVPLTGSQRDLVRLGMECMAGSRDPALHKLLELACVADGSLPTARDIAFGIAPRINAAGRMGHPKLALDALFCSSGNEAEQRVTELDDLNRRRRALEQELLPVLLAEIPPLKGGIIFYGAEWPKGIAGILASRAAEHFRRPAIVLVRDPSSGRLTGSGRSAPGVDLYAAVRQCAPWMDRFGGHAQAVGLTLKESNLKRFREAFQEATLECHTAVWQPPAEEAVLNLAAVNRNFWEGARALEPFGVGFPPLVFRIPEANLEKRPRGRPRLGQGGKHLDVLIGPMCPETGDGDFLVEMNGNSATVLSRV